MCTVSVENAVILAAGFASRFLPLSDIIPKALLPVKGEILIERQIRQLKESGIKDIYVVVGHLKEQFSYLPEKYGIKLLENREYHTRNNHSSIWCARSVLSNTYICSSDNYFTENVFTSTAGSPYYAALYSPGVTEEYCLQTASDGRITGVTIGGQDSWYMLGHVLFDQNFSRKLLHYIEQDYSLPKIKNQLWENIYMEHLDELSLYIKKYDSDVIYEFDNVDELSRFDSDFQVWYQHFMMKLR